jgi:hypothetical protein
MTSIVVRHICTRPDSFWREVFTASRGCSLHGYLSDELSAVLHDKIMSWVYIRCGPDHLYASVYFGKDNNTVKWCIGYGPSWIFEMTTSLATRDTVTIQFLGRVGDSFQIPFSPNLSTHNVFLWNIQKWVVTLLCSSEFERDWDKEEYKACTGVVIPITDREKLISFEERVALFLRRSRALLDECAVVETYTGCKRQLIEELQPNKHTRTYDDEDAMV